MGFPAPTITPLWDRQSNSRLKLFGDESIYLKTVAKIAFPSNYFPICENVASRSSPSKREHQLSVNPCGKIRESRADYRWELSVVLDFVLRSAFSRNHSKKTFMAFGFGFGSTQ